MNLDSSTRGHGAGSALLRQFIDQCKAANVAGIHLSTRGDNAPAHRFFEKHGFAKLAVINAYKPGPKGLEPVPVLIMGRKV
jgi:ribosomal protein S18 acetylase RimI-like enzyme